MVKESPFLITRNLFLSSSNKNFSGAITLYYDWNNEEDKALATQYGFICDTRRCTWMLDGLKGSIHQKK